MGTNNIILSMMRFITYTANNFAKNMDFVELFLCTLENNSKHLCKLFISNWTFKMTQHILNVGFHNGLDACSFIGCWLIHR